MQTRAAINDSFHQITWRRGRDSNPRTPFRMLHTFQACAFDRSATSPINLYSNSTPGGIDSGRPGPRPPGAVAKTLPRPKSLPAILSNPRTRLGVTHYPGVRLRPLGHLSTRPQGYRRRPWRSNLGACLTNDRCRETGPRRPDFCDRYASHSGYYVSERIEKRCRWGGATHCVARLARVRRMRRTGDHGWSPRACAEHGQHSAMASPVRLRSRDSAAGARSRRIISRTGSYGGVEPEVSGTTGGGASGGGTTVISLAALLGGAGW